MLRLFGDADRCERGDLKYRFNKGWLMPTLYVETDWDFALRFKGVVYSQYDFELQLCDAEELRSIELLGPFGSSLGKRGVDGIHAAEFLEGVAAILNNPSEPFSNTGGNRGVTWTPGVGIKQVEDFWYVSGWRTEYRCIACKKVLSYGQMMNSRGRCTYCGHIGRGAVTIVDVERRDYRLVRHAAWWKFWVRPIRRYGHYYGG